MKVLVIYCAIRIILFAVCFVLLNGAAILSQVLNIYALMIVYSLWIKFQEENDVPDPKRSPSTIAQNVV
jgi:hypothetical protein